MARDKAQNQTARKASQQSAPPEPALDQLPAGPTAQPSAPAPVSDAAAAGASAYVEAAADGGGINLDGFLDAPEESAAAQTAQAAAAVASAAAATAAAAVAGLPPNAAAQPSAEEDDFPAEALETESVQAPAAPVEPLKPKGRFSFIFSGLSTFFKWLWAKFKAVPPLEDLFDQALFTMGMQRKPSSMLRRANTLAHKGRLVEAVKWYRDILALRPLSVEAYDGLGRAYFRMGLNEEAEREFTIAENMERLLHNRDDIESAAALAIAFLERKQPKLSVSFIEPVLIAHFYSPNNADLLKAMGRVYAELRASKKMYQVYSAGLAQYPDDYEFHILKGNAEIKLGRVAEGERLVRWGRLMKKLRENPSDANAKMAMGELYLKEQKTEEGLQYLREAAVLSPDNTGLRWRLFNLYLKADQVEEAQKYLLEIVALEPDNEDLQYRLADFYRKHQKKEQALAIYKDLAERHSREPKPHALAGELMMEMGMFEEGQKINELAQILECGLKDNPDHRETVTFMKYLMSIGQYQEANQWLERGLNKWPYHGELVLTKARQLYHAYRYPEAVALLKRLISVKPDVAEPHIWVAMCYQRQGDNMGALAEAQLATRLAPKSFSAHKALGDILKEQKKLSQANAAYEVAEMMRQSHKK